MTRITYTKGNECGDAGASLILVVDDRSDSRRHIASRLSRLGHRILEASDGIEALRSFESRRPDAVVTDMRMPKSDGFDLLGGLKSQSRVAVFCVTAYPDWESALLAVKRGASHYYRWPRDFERLIADVDETVRAARKGVAAAGSIPSLDAIRQDGRRLEADSRRRRVREALEHTGGNIGKAAQLLKVSRRTVYNWMERYGVPRN